MLSYQHGFHAGNLADVHKHALLAWMLGYLVQKPKPLSYLETHAGRGLYDLAGPDARKTGEAEKGIGTVSEWFVDHPFGDAVDRVRKTHGKSAYPGSPLIAAQLLRPVDKITLADLHPQESAALKDAMLGVSAQVVQKDGFEMAISRTPPEPRRGILLCDPPYEVKSDYQNIPEFFAKLHRRWPVGVLVLWLPILSDERHKPMIQKLTSHFKDALFSQVAFAPARPGHGMIGSGLFVVNPPYGLAEEATRIEALFASLP